MRKATTNPQIDGKPMSFVRLSSTVAGRYYDPTQNGRFNDSRGKTYQVREGTVMRVRTDSK